MTVRIYGFNWETYTQRVMPAFKLWLTQKDESQIYTLYTQTRCFREEHFLPPAMQPLRTWSRAQTFVQQLPQGPQTQREYALLCSAETFTDLSDSYVHKHPPQLYQNIDALRAVWGAIVAEYCLSCFLIPHTDAQIEISSPQNKLEETEASRSEIISLLESAGLHELAREIQDQSLDEDWSADEQEDEEEEAALAMHGIELGRHPATLHLRGWLATISVRAMALFELLACGRRCLPFGYRAGEPYEDFVGYLTPDEVWQFSRCLRLTQAPDAHKVEADYAVFHQAQSFKMIDEILPSHAENLLTIIHQAAQHGLGLLCSS
ncbi:hypothetical protein [Dictyobacter kobayashii]|uniref:Uncharacterized protein n=1 Tax=Dictyobacter kobayashii TaxID=2014872 RepID=A0A402AMR4_9CHLR|nr:hypothetical protein [Dictyobacter kobayashii]GCE20339.1 hypothetical protein KDK_41390 [Dictyobacter kobayashii]